MENIVSSIVLLLALTLAPMSGWAEEAEDPLDVQLGEKLFLEDRFSYSYFHQAKGDVNSQNLPGDPVLQKLETPVGAVEHPHRDRQMSCASCHFVDQTSTVIDNKILTYNDLTWRTPVPDRQDGQFRTLRNSMNFVLATLEDGKPLHWDGEFFSAKDLACASLRGRNMGWLAAELSQATQHIVNVVKNDNGTYFTASDLKDPYPATFKALGYDLESLNGEQTFNLVCQIMAAYMASVDFARDEEGEFVGSAYDKFLQINGLPRSPRTGQSTKQYIQELRDTLASKQDWQWIAADLLVYHNHPAEFGPLELTGMNLFFGRGQCVSCHQAPNFTDSGFHNVGHGQVTYDRVHGQGAFKQLAIPNWDERVGTSWLDTYRQAPSASDRRLVDLGVWNMLGHPEKNEIQGQLREAICQTYDIAECRQWSDEILLEKSVALFKTPTLRSLGQSKPYFHNGSAAELTDVLLQYFVVSHQARAGLIRNADPLLPEIRINPFDLEALAAFLRALDEDYD